MLLWYYATRNTVDRSVVDQSQKPLPHLNAHGLCCVSLQNIQHAKLSVLRRDRQRCPSMLQRVSARDICQRRNGVAYLRLQIDLCIVF